MSNETTFTSESEEAPKTEAEEIREIIEEGLPDCIKREQQDVIDAVMSPARSVLRAANPATTGQARQWRGSLVRMLLYIYKTYGEVDVKDVLTHDVIDDYIGRVNKKESSGWKKTHRSWLRYLGLVTNPQAWPKPEKLTGHVAADTYDADEEGSFKLTGELACFKGNLDQAFVVVGSLGAGLSGVEMARVSPDDVVELIDGRLGIWIVSKTPRLVPVRVGYTELLGDVCGAAKGERFIHQNYPNAVHNISRRIIGRGFGHLALPRGRSTWLTAHLRAGTPLDALWMFAGPLSSKTLNDLLDVAVGELTPEDAALKGLRA